MSDWRPTHVERALFPDDGITKGDLLAYYDGVAGAILPHLDGRPLNLERFPRGLLGPRVHQKQIPANAPEWVRTVEVYAPTSRRTIRYAVGGARRSLAYLVNLGVIELHPWASRADRIDLPDRVIFDLDPTGVGMPEVSAVAHALRDAVGARGLRAYPKTSGGRGLHIYVPIRRGPSFEATRAFADAVAAEVAASRPGCATASHRPADKAGHVYIDTLRNGRAQTAVAPYSVRAKPGAPVSTPLAWDEVVPSVDPRAFTLRSVPRRLAERGDLFRAVLQDHQPLPRG